MTKRHAKISRSKWLINTWSDVEQVKTFNFFSLKSVLLIFCFLLSYKEGTNSVNHEFETRKLHYPEYAEKIGCVLSVSFHIKRVLIFSPNVWMRKCVSCFPFLIRNSHTWSFVEVWKIKEKLCHLSF